MTIMIIEDSKPMRNLIKRTLKQAGFGDHEIIEAGDGEAGLSLIKSSKPDLVLCDWNMPKMNGMELLKTLKREAIDVKFGFVTSEQSQEMRDDAQSEGALFLIGKPFTAENFNRELTAVFGKDDASGTSIPLKDWLDAVVLATKQVSSNPLGFASEAEVVAYTTDIPSDQMGSYLPFEGGDDLLWLCMFSDARGAQSLSRALFALGPDEEDLPPDEVGDAIGEILNIVAGLVKSQMEPRGVRCKIGLPQYMESSKEVMARAHRSSSEIRLGPVSGHLSIVKVQ
jgi:two-component system chemotaxis response regulator CheY